MLWRSLCSSKSLFSFDCGVLFDVGGTVSAVGVMGLFVGVMSLFVGVTVLFDGVTVFCDVAVVL